MATEVDIETGPLTKPDRRRLTLWLYIFAWCVEIAAAGIGLTLAVTRLSDDISSLYAALPFFAVAILELIKIPLAKVAFVERGLRRVAMILAISLSMVITFETFLMGFDIYQAETAIKIKPTLDAVKDIKQQIDSANKNIDASKEISKTSENGSQNYRNQITSINEKWDRIIKANENEKRSIFKSYEGSTEEIKSNIKQIREKIDDEIKQRDRAISEENEQLSINREATRQNVTAEITRLQSQLTELDRKEVALKDGIRKKASSDYKECQFLCGVIRENEKKDLDSLDKKLGEQRAKIQKRIGKLQSNITGTASGSSKQRKDAIRREFSEKIEDLQNQLAAKVAERARVRGNISATDKSLIKDLNEKIRTANKQRNLELKEAQSSNKQRREQVDSANGDIAKTTKQKNELRKQLSPYCAELNNAVTDNQVYRLAMQFYGVDDACNLEQQQITMVQWLWFGSLAFVTSALGTTLAFASLFIKYPSVAPNRGGIAAASFNFFRRLGNEIYGLMRRTNYALVLLHRRLRRPKIKEVLIEKEIIKEVTKEIPVEKIVIQEVPVEIVKKEIIHVPLFTQDVKAVTKDG